MLIYLQDFMGITFHFILRLFTNIDFNFQFVNFFLVWSLWRRLLVMQSYSLYMFMSRGKNMANTIAWLNLVPSHRCQALA
jgi:hypothetical protein